MVWVSLVWLVKKKKLKKKVGIVVMDPETGAEDLEQAESPE